MTWPKPCPKCKTKPRVQYVRFPGGYLASCGCGFPSAEGKTDSAAIRAWNRNVNEYLKSAVGRQNARRAKEA